MDFVPLLPLFPLDVVLFPGAPLPLHIFEPRYKEMIGECLEMKRSFGMVRAHENALAEIGCTAAILNVSKKYDDGRLDITTQGKQRFEIVQLNQERSFLQAEVLFFDDDPSQVDVANVETVVKLHEQLLGILGQDAQIERNQGQVSFQLAHDLLENLNLRKPLLEMNWEGRGFETLSENYRRTIPRWERRW